MTSFADKFLLAAMVAAAEGRFGLAPAAVEEVRDRLRDLERQAARRRVQAVARGQLELRLDASVFPAFRLPGRRAPGDPFAIVVTELRGGQRGAGRAHRGRHTRVQGPEEAG